jgi:ubiquinone/menaquinone biosynthesis C-methylase UbiE
MTTPHIDKAFTGSVPRIYESLLVPLIFEPYADDLVRRVVPAGPARILEVAAGTGVVTRRLVDALPAAAIVATDLNQAMLDQAAAVGTSRPVEWRQADAMSLPFADGAFDAVVIQFGVMFFPDKAKAFAEARRVLAPGGLLAFNVWDRLHENEFAAVVEEAAGTMFPGDPPRFLGRTPYGYYERTTIEQAVTAGGFATPQTFDTIAARSRADSAKVPAIAYCQGSPLRGEIEARHAPGLDAVTNVAAEAIAQRFGRGAVNAKIQAHVVTVRRAER